jgi:branched-chain amino acid transport system ATP-binding protein
LKIITRVGSVDAGTDRFFSDVTREVLMLEGVSITKRFGGLSALSKVDFLVEEKEIVGLIGPNGAGKTTLFHIASGVYKPDSGGVKFKGKYITGLKPHRFCRLGISRTYQTPRPFMEMTVLQNMMVSQTFGGGTSDRHISEILEFLEIADSSGIQAKNISPTKKKLVEIAVALATGPEILLLDEIAAGLNPTEILKMMEMIKRIRDELGVTVFWIEHIMKAVMAVVDRLIVLNHGVKIAEGRPEEIANDEKVLDAYLGRKL